ncbi:LytR C-terminal domain-containing protein [Geodermatophilus sp. URMC 64]
MLNTTGDPAVADEAADLLAVPGVVVGTVTTTGDATASAIAYPAAEQEQASLLAEALGAADLLQAADVPHVTVVLGPDGLESLLVSLEQFAGLPAPDCEPAG